MNRADYSPPFSKSDFPEWSCPRCSQGKLKFQSNLKIEVETKDSQFENGYYEDFEDEDSSKIYTWMLKCSNNYCRIIVANIGSLDSFLFSDFDEIGESCQSNIENFTPYYFHPSLQIFKIPKNCPQNVSSALNESFKLFFASPKASANQARISLETLFDELKIPKVLKTKSNQIKKLTLHQRIDKLPEKYKHFQTLLKAIKWLGNAGSHSRGDLTHENVLDLYEFFEHILSEIYDSKAKKLEAKALKIIKKKGP